MPLTPIHCSIAYLVKDFRRSLSLPALLVSTMAPDLEIPFTYLATGGQNSRLMLHSFLGAASLATVLSVVLTVFAYAPVVSRVFKIDYGTLSARCRFSWSLVGVCLLGTFSHVLMDAFHHEYNPLFLPFTYDSIDNLVFMNNWTSASIVIPLAFLSLLILFIAIEVRGGAKNIWIRLLVE
jgi:membrane-bound metal-dependent hydrolase YbcI (DUF457 family)